MLLAGCKKATKGTFHENFLGYSVMKGLQGFAALGVILHHVTQIVTRYGQFDKGLINVMNDAGVFFTALFFFCSGFYMWYSIYCLEKMKRRDCLYGR